MEGVRVGGRKRGKEREGGREENVLIMHVHVDSLYM